MVMIDLFIQVPNYSFVRELLRNLRVYMKPAHFTKSKSSYFE